jgi:hypothetical protein
MRDKISYSIEFNQLFAEVRYWGLRDKEGRPPPFKGFLLVEKIIGKRTTKVTNFSLLTPTYMIF